MDFVAAAPTGRSSVNLILHELHARTLRLTVEPEPNIFPLTFQTIRVGPMVELLGQKESRRRRVSGLAKDPNLLAGGWLCLTGMLGSASLLAALFLEWLMLDQCDARE